MIPPLSKTVLVDRTFFDALLSPDDPHRDDALACYEELLVEYESGQTMIVTLDDALAGTLDPERARRIAAVCDVMRTEADVRREIRRIRADDTAWVAAGLDDVQLATMVVLVRHHIDELASFDPALSATAIAERLRWPQRSTRRLIDGVRRSVALRGRAGTADRRELPK